MEFIRKLTVRANKKPFSILMAKQLINLKKEVFNNDGSRMRKYPDGKVRKIGADG
jgi:hypothetical protein